MILPDPAKIAAYAIPGNERSYTASDALLYALGLGLGSDPVDRDEHPFVYEEWGPKVLPTLATVLGEDFRWLEDPAFGVGDAPNVHGDETLILHAPLKPEGRLASQSRIAGLYDRGPGSHGILIFEEELRDAATGTLVATRRQTDVLIGAGGFGGEPPPPADRPAPPDRAPDHAVTRGTLAQAALLYRLSGDHYKLHVEPEYARSAGFNGPILHGLATYGLACHAVVATCCDHDPAAIARFFGRFTAPVYPGETLITELWREGSTIWFRVKALERDIVVIDNGRADLRG
jgi:acyl dehydratase